MKIEVATKKDDAPKVKGDLLEDLSQKLLQAQGYEVIKEIRFTGVELDLLCKHKVSGKEIYVECKAQKDNIGAPILTKLLGTVSLYEYTEGWLITTASFGKEAKGFIEVWKKKDLKESSKLSFYSPELIIDSLEKASIIKLAPIDEAAKFIGNKEFLGEWTLLVTVYGKFWIVYTLQGGIPSGVLIYNATNGRHIQDKNTIDNIGLLETIVTEYNLYVGVEDNTQNNNSIVTSPNVVEVQIGDSWDDYRPSRPEDFIGRDNTQKEIFNFFNNVKEKSSDTRIFAITGNSGLGKSSLIAKVRDKSRNKFYKNRYFTFAVDIRGAKSPSYISASLLKCLENAQLSGFGDNIDLKLTNPTSPLSSTSIDEYLETVERKGQVICLIFDQFEELYSKPELLSIFSASKELMLEVASYKGNLTLGFAWKTDSVTQHDHPAYHMWQTLSDYRKVYKLKVFDKGEMQKVITKFEKVIDQKIPIETRHQIIQACQGFPWLLKKLCINLYENIKKDSNDQSILIDLDIGRLFEDDVETLSSTERTCLQLVAEKAPADWSEIIDISGIAILNMLVEKRLVIRSGDRLNIYWDIFKDYLLTKKVPIVPFNYIPTSDFSSLIKVSKSLNSSSFIESQVIADKTSLNINTIINIGADLVMLGISERKGSSFKYHRELKGISEADILGKLREKWGNHSLKLAIYKESSGKVINQEKITNILKMCIPNAKFSEKTWTTYTRRLINFLICTGYLVKKGKEVIVQDIGNPVFDNQKIGIRNVVFTPTAPPSSVCELLNILETNNSMTNIESMGYRNSISILKRFDLIIINNNIIEINKLLIEKYGGINETIWTLTNIEPVISKCIEILNIDANITGPDLAKKIAIEYNLSWTLASMKRNGNSLKQWSKWIIEGINTTSIPTPPGRSK